MEKVKLDKQAFIYPMPMIIVGAEVAKKPNYMAVAWVTPVGFNPMMFAVALGRSHDTNKGIREHGEFSISIPGQDLLQATDHIGLVSGADVDKSRLFETFYGELKHAPMIKECPLNMEFRMFKIVDLLNSDLFIGELVSVWCGEKFLTDGKPDIEKIAPFTVSIPDNRYWAVGQCIGKAWNTGKSFTR